MTNKPKIYIDGQSGTTGLQIVSRIKARNDVELLTIDDDKRHDDAERARFFNMADVAFLCLPDKEALHAVKLVQNPDTCIIDASTAHRCCDDWVYGFAELSNEQRKKIAASKRIANPGCHATGFIAAAAPLVFAGILPKDYPIVCFSITGYSGGGKKMIAEYESEDAQNEQCIRGNDDTNIKGERHAQNNEQGEHHAQLLSSPGLYGLNMQHKHLPEMQKMCKLDIAPGFVPIVSNYYKGMATSIVLHNKLLNGVLHAKEVHEALDEHYKKTSGSNGFVQVRPFSKDSNENPPTIYAAELAGSAKLELFVSGNKDKTCIISIFDNLGKGASAAAVQNMNIALGLPEDTGL